MNAVLVGQHVSGGLSTAQGLLVSKRRGASAAQVFAGSPRSYGLAGIDAGGDERLPVPSPLVASAGGPVSLVVHGAYVLTLTAAWTRVVGAGWSPSVQAEKSMKGALRTLRWAEAAGAEWAVLHPGSTRDAGVPGSGRSGWRASAELWLDQVLADYSGPVKLCLETMPGRTALGSRWEDLSDLVDVFRGDPRLGICVDTTHSWAAGYSVQEVAEQIRDERTMAVHLNAPNPGLRRGGRRDGHRVPLLGGEFSEEDVRLLAVAGARRGLPMIVEGTPRARDDYALVRRLVKDETEGVA